MRPIILLVVPVLLTVNAFAQDWYHQRELRYSGEGWRAHLFIEVRTDLEHIWGGRAQQKERDRIAKTEEELTKMQADLDQTRWDNGLLNDVIDSIEKSSHDDRLAPGDRDALADDLAKLRAFQKMHHKN
ncbi:MAG TPA: hypothetical protein VGM43_09135 [Bryobacteraceae bacterium]|jgi:hypothetical protein